MGLEDLEEDVEMRLGDEKVDLAFADNEAVSG